MFNQHLFMSGASGKAQKSKRRYCSQGVDHRVEKSRQSPRDPGDERVHWT